MKSAPDCAPGRRGTFRMYCVWTRRRAKYAGLLIGVSVCWWFEPTRWSPSFFYGTNAKVGFLTLAFFVSTQRFLGFPPRQLSWGILSVRNEIFRPTSETAPVAPATPYLD